MIKFKFLNTQQNDLLEIFSNELMNFKHLLTKNQPEKEIKRLITDGVLSERVFIKKINTPSPLVDVGSGLGFPGIIFAILNSNISVILLEPSEKRSEFLKHSVLKLNLTDQVEVIKKPFGFMSEKIFLFKAFASLDKTLILLKKYLSSDSSSYHFKSSGYKNEWESLSTKQKSFWKMNVFAEYVFESQKRFILEIKKASP